MPSIPLIGLLRFLLVAAVWLQSPAAAAGPDWRDDWALEENFALSRDAEGFQFPTALAFVPEPGPAPDDPLYFVTELRGKVKVVTNDRQVYAFAENFFSLPIRVELPSTEAEVGLAGICLDPVHGYVFVTFAYRDSNGILRNNLVRFQSRPGRFSLTPSGNKTFGEIFAADHTNPSHQIGPCQVDGDQLYVSVGDGAQRPKSRQLDSTLGKILRLTLDGEPGPNNPFQVPGRREPADYVWAAGMRNTFGLKVVGGRPFAAQNGPQIDSFFEVERGRRYLWDGNDWSFGLNVPVVFWPTLAPVQLDYLPSGEGPFPSEFRDQFYVAACGAVRGVVVIDYDREGRVARSVPRVLLRDQERRACVTGLAFGPDGLYVAPLIEDPAVESPIIKISYDPAHPHPHLVSQFTDPGTLFTARGCYGCHRLGGFGSEAAPHLDAGEFLPRLQQRLSDPAYHAEIERLDRLDAEPFRTYRAARAEVAAATGLDQARLWITYRLLEPKFDNPDASMPNLGLSRAEADMLAAFLARPTKQGPRVWLREHLPTPRYRHIALAFIAGLAIAFWFGRRR